MPSSLGSRCIFGGWGWDMIGVVVVWKEMDGARL